MGKHFKSLADYIDRSGETQESLAARAGLSQPTISRAKSNGAISLRTAKRLSALTGVPVESFGQKDEAA